jgi:hypothetical protein
MFIKLALTLFFKRQQHRKLSWLDKDSDKDQLNTFYTIHRVSPKKRRVHSSLIYRRILIIYTPN